MVHIKNLSENEQAALKELGGGYYSAVLPWVLLLSEARAECGRLQKANDTLERDCQKRISRIKRGKEA